MLLTSIMSLIILFAVIASKVSSPTLPGRAHVAWVYLYFLQHKSVEGFSSASWLYHPYKLLHLDEGDLRKHCNHKVRSQATGLSIWILTPKPQQFLGFSPSVSREPQMWKKLTIAEGKVWDNSNNNNNNNLLLLYR